MPKGLEIFMYTKQNCKHFVDFKNLNYTNPNGENLDIFFFYNMEKEEKEKEKMYGLQKIICTKD